MRKNVVRSPVGKPSLAPYSSASGPSGVCYNHLQIQTTDVRSGISLPTRTGFQVWVSTMDGVWNAAGSSDFPIGYRVTCLR